MKHLLVLVLEDNSLTSDLLHSLAAKGFNATVINSTSLKHILHSETADMPFFVTLNMLTRNSGFEENLTAMMVLEDGRLNEAQEFIREKTENFVKAKGGMFALALENYEGSF